MQLPGGVIGFICIVTDCKAIRKLVNKDVVVFSLFVLFVDGKFCPQEHIYISYFVSSKVHHLSFPQSEGSHLFMSGKNLPNLFSTPGQGLSSIFCSFGTI